MDASYAALHRARPSPPPALRARDDDALLRNALADRAAHGRAVDRLLPHKPACARWRQFAGAHGCRLGAVPRPSFGSAAAPRRLVARPEPRATRPLSRSRCDFAAHGGRFRPGPLPASSPPGLPRPQRARRSSASTRSLWVARRGQAGAGPPRVRPSVISPLLYDAGQIMGRSSPPPFFLFSSWPRFGRSRLRALLSLPARGHLEPDVTPVPMPCALRTAGAPPARRLDPLRRPAGCRPGRSAHASAHWAAGSRATLLAALAAGSVTGALWYGEPGLAPLGPQPLLHRVLLVGVLLAPAVVFDHAWLSSHSSLPPPGSPSGPPPLRCWRRWTSSRRQRRRSAPWVTTAEAAGSATAPRSQACARAMGACRRPSPSKERGRSRGGGARRDPAPAGAAMTRSRGAILRAVCDSC